MPEQYDFSQYETNEKTAEKLKEPAAKKSVLDDIAGRLPNAASMGYSGAQLGMLTGNPLAGVAGGIAGGTAGFLMTPSDTPGTDAGALAGDVATDLLMRKMGVPGGGLKRLLAQSAAVGSGALIGSMGDKAADYVHDTPWGQIALYTGVTAGTLALGDIASWMSKPSAGANFAQQLKQMTGFDYPLSVGERFERVGGLSEMLTRGMRSAAQLGEQQADVGARAMEKIVGKLWGNATVPNVEAALDVRKTAGKTLEDWISKNTKTVKDIEIVPSKVLLPNGSPIPAMKHVTKKIEPTYDDFAKAMGLDEYEAKFFQTSLRTNPEKYVNYFINPNKADLQGMFALRAMKKVLPAEDFAPLGTAIITQLLVRGKAFRETAQGLHISGDSFASALFDKFGVDKLKVMFGADTVDALTTLAQVMKESDPLKKLAGGSSQVQQTFSYLGHKYAFAIGSIAGVGMAGGAAGAGVGSTLAGGALGAAIAVPAYVFLAKMMSNPDLSKFLQMASRGDATAAAKIVRTLTSAAASPAASEPVSTPTTRLEEMFTFKPR
jgi:hypothetical protein